MLTMEFTYDIVMREDDFVLYANGKPVLSEQGNEVSHSNARILRFAITQGMLSPLSENYPLELLLSLILSMLFHSGISLL